MWKWIAGALMGVVLAVGGVGFYLSDKIYLHWPEPQIAASEFGRKYSRAELRADFRALTAAVERIHPDVAVITDKTTYAALKAKTLAALDHPMTRVAFYRVLATFDGHAYADGHTDILAPQAEWDAYTAQGGRVPSFSIAIGDDGITVERSLDPELPAGAQLVSLNGMDAGSLRDWLVWSQSMEAESGRRAYATRRFPIRMWALGLRPPFRVTFRSRDGAEHGAILTGISSEAWNKAFLLGEGNALHLTMRDRIAHLAVRNFEMPWDSYSTALHDVFQKIHDAKATALILDLRENNGGDTRQSDTLQTYLSAKLLPALERVEVHATPEVKAAYRTLLPEGFRWIPINALIPQLSGIQTAPDNGTFALQPDGVAPSERGSQNPLLFSGNLYVLISPYTYSTALIAAAPYKYWKRATLIGETTSEPTTFFGDNYEFFLPNTRLQMNISHKRFVLFGSKGPHAGLEPDIAVSAAQPDALAIAYAEIVRRRAGVSRPGSGR